MGYDETVVFLRVLQLLVYVLSTEYDRERNATKSTTSAMSPVLRYTAPQSTQPSLISVV
jgi:hypothetical protein